MFIEPNSEQEEILDRAAKSGLSPEEVIHRAFAVIEDQLQHEEWLLTSRSAVAAQIDEGFEQAERGELYDPEEAIRIFHSRRIDHYPA